MSCAFCFPVEATLYERPDFRRAAQQAGGLALRPGGLELTARAIGLCGWPEGAVVADVGCGAGATLKLLREMGFKAQGFDLSEAMLREARMNSGCPTGKADAARLPLATGSIGAVVCECLLSMLDEPDLTLAEFYRVLAPGGGLMLADIAECISNPMEAAVSAAVETGRLLERHGFVLRQSLEHPGALKALAAQLLWLGARPEDFMRCLNVRSGIFSSCASSSSRTGSVYCQWIACKPDNVKETQ
jgi:SAM-dependent methyltransferase